MSINKITLPNGTTHNLVPGAGEIVVKSKLYFEAVDSDGVSHKKLIAEYIAPDPDTIDEGELVFYDVNGNPMFTMNMNSYQFAQLIVSNVLIAGKLNANNLTANKILVSDSNKNIVSSNLTTSDLITTSNIGSQSVNYANSAGSATRATSLGNAGSTDKNPVNGNGWYSVAKAQTKPSVYSQEPLAINWYWGVDVRTGSNDWFKINGNSVISSAGGTINGSVNLNGDVAYRINNKAQFYTLGTTIFGLCANSGATVRRYDNPNNYAGISANAFTNVSSRLIKKNIKNISDDEAKKILNLRIVDFDYEDIVGGEKGQIGLIAEEAIEVFPHCVRVPDNYNEETTKQQLSEGKVLDLLELDYSKLVAPLIKMVQIQQRQIDELKAEVERLKDAIES